MNILITGAFGQLGKDIQDTCDKNRVNYTAAGSKDLDITSLPSVRSYVSREGPDIIINCAAYNAVDRAESEWKKAFTVNGLGVRNLSLAANEVDACIVHYSTDYVFDGKSDRPYTIADIPNPISLYGKSKFLGEKMVRDIAHRFILIRTSWVFGIGNDNFPKKIIAWSKEKKEIKVVTDQVSSPTYTKDLARASLELIDKGGSGIYHITNAGQCSRYEWSEFILKEIGWQGTILAATSDEFPAPAKRPEFSVLDDFGTPEFLGHPLPDWKDATRRFLEEMKVLV